MRRTINFASSKARPEDVRGTIGVSDRIQDPGLKKAIAEQISQERASEVHESASSQAKAPSIDSVLTDITGSAGTFMSLPRERLEPTPEEWNPFSPVAQDKKILMAESIYRNGLQQPIVVRRIAPDTYQILAGNTRNEIYGILYDLTGDDKYQYIDAKVYDKDELTEDQAREIASDTNYVQRAELSSKDKAFAIHTKVEMLKKRKASDILNKVAEQMHIKKTTVFYWNKLVALIPEFAGWFDEGKIRLKTASRIAGWPEDIQRDLWMRREKLTDTVIARIPAKTIFSDIIPMFDHLIQEQENPFSLQGLEFSIEQDDDQIIASISGKIPDGCHLKFLVLPEDQEKTFNKKYKDYLLKE